MTKYFAIISLVLYTTISAYGEKGALYFWQRQRTPETTSLLAQYHGLQIYALTGEYQQDGQVLLLKELPNTIPVFRLHATAWHHPNLPAKLAQQLKNSPATEIQLDCDVPESQLGAYGLFLQHLRKLIPGKKLSITLLPCHLKNLDLKAVLAEVEYFVIQVHALEKPRDLPIRYQLFNHDLATAAVRAAKNWQKPFKIALPVYAYELHYDRQTGAFRRLSAESTATTDRHTRKIVAAPDWRELAAFRRSLKAIPVIWFRMYQDGDRLCLERANQERLDRGQEPRQEIELLLRTQGRRTELYWRNHGILGNPQYTQKLALPGIQAGECAFFNGITPTSAIGIGQLPVEVSGPLPNPGQTILIGEIYQ